MQTQAQLEGLKKAIKASASKPRTQKQREALAKGNAVRWKDHVKVIEDPKLEISYADAEASRRRLLAEASAIIERESELGRLVAEQQSDDKRFFIYKEPHCVPFDERWEELLRLVGY